MLARACFSTFISLWHYSTAICYKWKFRLTETIFICKCSIDSFICTNLFNSMWITNECCIVFVWVRHVVWIVSEIGYHCNFSNFDMGLHLKFALFTYSKRIVEFRGEACADGFWEKRLMIMDVSVEFENVPIWICRAAKKKQQQQQHIPWEQAIPLLVL